MDIIIRTIPESEMRPEVNGADWYFDKEGNLQVRVSPMSDQRYEILLAFHEAVEAIMCRQHGVDHHTVDQWDLEFDKTHTFDVNAGDFPDCPYRKEHCHATAIERILAAELDVVWEVYDKELRESYPGPSKATKNNASPVVEL